MPSRSPVPVIKTPAPDGILVPAGMIQKRVQELALEIGDDVRGAEVRVIGVLKGAVVFLSDLIRRLPVPVTLDFIAVSSYGVSTESSGVVRIVKDLDEAIDGANVLLVEDIVDTGLTLKYLMDYLKGRNPRLLRTCALLDKPERRLADVRLDYCGFKIPDLFVVGYGLDAGGKDRQHPFVAVMGGSALGERTLEQTQDSGGPMENV
ncbi:MAG: hypoxanthine phosphoribosyltransferase [Firmicutes bacterium]|nr:hypoxanthine phosphoribosyltransferase [Bacillota bacterium]